MRRVVGGVLLTLATALSVAPLFADAVQQEQPASGKILFVKPVALRGTLGDAQIQATLYTKSEMDDGIEGEYIVFGRSQNVLLAGEVEGDDLFLEESENGTDVSGQWDGKLTGDSISGEWQSADGKIKKPFNLKIVQGGDKPKSASVANPQNKQQ